VHSAGDFVQKIEKELRLKDRKGAKLLVGEDVTVVTVEKQKAVMNYPEDPKRPWVLR